MVIYRKKQKPKYSDLLSDETIPLVDRLKLCDKMMWSILLVGASSGHLSEHQPPDSTDFRAASVVLKAAIEQLKPKKKK